MFAHGYIAMLKYGIWDLPDLEYFSSKNQFSGSKGSFRFKIELNGNDFTVYYWYDDVCFEKRTQDCSRNFPASENSLYDINSFLTDKCAAERID